MKTLILILGMTVGLLAQGPTLDTEATAVFGTLHQESVLTITITNDGPSEAFGVILRFTPAKGLKVSLPAECQVLHHDLGAAVQCMVGYLAGGQSKQVDLLVRADKAGFYPTEFQASCTADACSGGVAVAHVSFD